MPISIYVDTSALEKALANVEGSDRLLQQFKIEARGYVAYHLALNTPRDKGRLINSIVSEDTPEGFLVYHKAKHALFVERGTGLFGPFRKLIFPTRARALRFVTDGQVIFAAYTVGQPGQWFIKKTEDEISGPVFDLAERLWVEHHQV